MDWRAKVELFEEIRREYEFGLGTIQGVARKLGVHRRMVREAIHNALPAQRKKTERPRTKMVPEIVDFIEAILEADRKAPRKQRHTARRIWERICQEVPSCVIAERTVRLHVEQRKQALGLARHEVFVPQSYSWGEEAQVDWYEAYADVGGERKKLQVFSIRSMASGAAYHRAYWRATQQAFLEAHQLAFHYFGGVFRKLRYDNLASAVKKILRGYERELTARFIAFRSHWQFLSDFCTPGQGHEKGGVEGEVGYFRRHYWVPVPVAGNLAELNAQLLEDCRSDQTRVIAGRSESVGAALLAEREHLLPVPTEDFDLAEISFPRVDPAGCAKAKMNFYSVPKKPGTVVEARIHSSRVEFWHEGICMAQHERSYDRCQQILELDHYLEVLEQKPGALRGSKPLAQWREQGRWPASYDALWERMMTRQGRQGGTRSMVALLRLGREFGFTKLRACVEQALQLGCTEVAAIHHLLMADELQHAAVESMDLGALAAYERPLPNLAEYNQLLDSEEAGLEVSA